MRKTPILKRSATSAWANSALRGGGTSARAATSAPIRFISLLRESAHDIARHLAVRDYLRAFPQEAAAYGDLKMRLAQRYPEDIEGYCDGKDAFVKALEQRALAWKEKHG